MRDQQLIRTVALAAALAFSASGCGQKKISECNALIEVINNGVKSLEKLPKSDDPTGVSDLQAQAAVMDKVAEEAAAIPATLPEIKRFSGEYQRMAREIAKAERDLAGAVQARDPDKRAAAEKTLDTVSKQEDPLLDSINGFCRNP